MRSLLFHLHKYICLVTEVYHFFTNDLITLCSGWISDQVEFKKLCPILQYIIVAKFMLRS